MKKGLFSLITALGLVFSLGLSLVFAQSENVYEQEVEFIEIDQELVNDAMEIQFEIDKYVNITDSGLLDLDPIVSDIYGEDLYKFYSYGIGMNNGRIINGDLKATENGIVSTEVSENPEGIMTLSGGCSWSNFGKNLIGGAVSGGAGGLVTGGPVTGGLGAIGGVAGGGLVHFTTCWW